MTYAHEFSANLGNMATPTLKSVKCEVIDSYHKDVKDVFSRNEEF